MNAINKSNVSTKEVFSSDNANTVLCIVISEKNHPFQHDIVGKSKEQLLNRRSYVLGAIYAWKNNIYNFTPDRVDYNVNYFEVELSIVNKELARFNAP